MEGSEICDELEVVNDAMEAEVGRSLEAVVAVVEKVVVEIVEGRADGWVFEGRRRWEAGRVCRVTRTRREEEETSVEHESRRKRSSIDRMVVVVGVKGIVNVVVRTVGRRSSERRPSTILSPQNEVDVLPALVDPSRRLSSRKTRSSRPQALPSCLSSPV